MAQQKNELYRTPDLYLSAFLRTAGCTQVKHEREENRVFFYFEDPGTISRLREDYYNGRAKVSALDYANNIRSQKSIIHS